MSGTRVWINEFVAEVWAVKKTITGGFENLPGDATLVVTANDEPIEVEVDGDSFSGVVTLKAGSNAIAAGFRTDDGQVEISAGVTYTLRVPDRPRAVIELELGDDTVKLSGNTSGPNEVSGAPVVSYQWTQRETNPELLQLSESVILTEADGESIELQLPKTDGEYYIGLTVVDESGKTDKSETYFVVEDGRARTVKWETENARWIDDALVYGVVPHNFGPDGFRSVTAKLDYLKDLGIDTIWLAPANATPAESGHSYNVSNYFELRPDYGTKEDFAELVKAAHERGIRVLMDVVPNHSAYEHRYFQHALEHGKSSPYYDFYDRDENGDYTYYFDWTHLPNLNYENPEVRRWMTEFLSYWVREFDVDGYRVDAIWGVRQRRPDFWPEMRAELQRIKPDVCLIAEASARDPYYVTQGFDGAYDWTDELGHWAWENVFEEKQGIAERLHAALTNNGKDYHEDSLTFRFLNNNDTDTRFLTRYGADLKRVGAALVWTLDGTPCLYTGEENGIEFRPYYTPEPISFTDRGYRDYYKKLVHIRKDNPALRSRKIDLLGAQGEAYAYLREGHDQRILVLLNFSGEETSYTLDLPAQFFDKNVQDVMSGSEVKLTQQMTLAPWDVKILVLG